MWSVLLNLMLVGSCLFNTFFNNDIISEILSWYPLNDFLAFDYWQPEKARSERIVNLAVAKHWVRFTWPILGRAEEQQLLLINNGMCEILTTVVNESQRGPHSLVL